MFSYIWTEQRHKTPGNARVGALGRRLCSLLKLEIPGRMFITHVLKVCVANRFDESATTVILACSTATASEESASLELPLAMLPSFLEPSELEAWESSSAATDPISPCCTWLILASSATGRLVFGRATAGFPGPDSRWKVFETDLPCFGVSQGYGQGFSFQT